jgi:hypothetical protein
LIDYLSGGLDKKSMTKGRKYNFFLAYIRVSYD